MTPKGIFLISLDFELYWGVFHRKNAVAYEENLWGARQVIPKILELFVKYGIHATWAVVGFLFFEGLADLLQALPDLKPAYRNGRFSSYEHLKRLGAEAQKLPLHFAPFLIQAILKTPHQEIASHTFSHYYCWEPGQNAATFRADLEASLKTAKRWGLTLKSIVFPKNMVNPEYLPICAQYGLTAYRGTIQHWLSGKSSNSLSNKIRKGLRLLNHYVNLTGFGTYPLPGAGCPYPVNLAGSSFLRPYNHYLQGFENLRLKRLTDCLDAAATRGQVYHLWWHPHNFGRNQQENLAFLEAILQYYAKLEKSGKMLSLTMAEAAALALARGD